MRAPWTNHLHLLTLLTAGGCTLLVGAQLSDKPAGTGGAGGQEDAGSGGSGTASSSAQSSGAQSSSTSSSTSSGVSCPPNTANCDGIAAHGCNVNLQNDPHNCGSCDHVCTNGMQHCAGGSCK
jgi:hypothetical protein